MASVNDIMSDINLRYRNSFTIAQKLVWMNEEQEELFDILELDSPPLTFQTVQDQNIYPFPSDLDISKIKVVTMEMGNGAFSEVDFKRNDDNEVAGNNLWYTVVSDCMFLYTGGEMPNDKKVYIYLDSNPNIITVENMGTEPSIPRKYQEILKLGVLKRICAARKDIEFQNNYDAEREQKITDVLWSRKLAEPEYNQPIDVLTKAGSVGCGLGVY